MTSGDDISSLAIAAAFAQFGKAAVYTPAGGEAQSITVMLSSPDLIASAGGIRQTGEAPIIEMMVSEVAAPKKGDALVIGTDAFYLSTPRHPDKRRLKWSVELNRA